MAAVALVFKPAAPGLKEQPNSPRWSSGERLVVTTAWRGKTADCNAAFRYRGQPDPVRPGFFVTQCELAPDDTGGTALLTITSELRGVGTGPGGAAALPEPGWQFDPFEINPPLSQHPAFADLTDKDWELIRHYEEATGLEKYENWGAQINALASPRDAQAALYLTKHQAGVETYYLAGLEYTWTEHVWVVPPLTVGGVIQAPSGPGAPYAPADFSWLRLADGCDRSSGVIKVTRRWKGAPAGVWDPDLYS